MATWVSAGTGWPSGYLGLLGLVGLVAIWVSTGTGWRSGYLGQSWDWLA